MGRKGKRIRNPYGLHTSQFIASVDRNDIYFQHWYDRLLSLAALRFRWNGLPDTVDERYLELTLVSTGCAVFFRDEIVEQYLALKAANYGRWDIYNIPMKRTAYGSNGYQYRLSNENSVLIFNNILHRDILNTIRIYATRLTEIDRTIDVNLNAQKTPIVILCDESQQLTMENLYMQYEGNYPFIFGNKTINRDMIEALQTGAPFIAKDAHDLRTELWNEFLTFMGYSNTSTQKRERMITDEVMRGMGGSLANRNDGWFARQQACDQINRMFGLNVSVEFREELPDTLRDMMQLDQKEQAEPQQEEGDTV